jgi:hypothetical protein
LTQQLEMARVEEAKEIPSVKVLDPADVPEKKSGPARVLITIGGLLASIVLGSVFVIGNSVWKQIDASDPRKKVADEIWRDTQPTYSELQERAYRIGSHFRRNSNGHHS